MKWFHDLSIFTKIISGYALTATLLVAGGVTAMNRQATLNATVHELGFDALPGMQHVGGARLALAQFRLDELRLLTAPGPASDSATLQRAKAESQAKVESELERYLPTCTSDAERRSYGDFKIAWGSYQAVDETLVSLVRAGKRAEAAALFDGEAADRFQRVAGHLDSIIAKKSTRGERASLDADTMAASMNGLSYEIMGLLVALLFVLGVSMARGIATPVRELTAVAKKLAVGDLSQQIQYRSKDELGVLADGFRETLGYIHGVAEGCKQLGAGDLMVEIAPKSDADELSKSFQGAVQSLRTTMLRMAETSVSLSGAAEELGAVSRQMGANADETSSQANVVAAAAEQVSMNVQTVASSTEEMSASIKEVAKNAAEAARVASTAVKVASRTNIIVTKLGESSGEIGKVIKVITSIAEQTNLLALIATIEAARAGDAGKGFAVVANEVKELAKETARATEDIGRKIAAIQSDAKEAVEAIAQISLTIDQVNDIQSTIAGAVEEQAATTNEIGRNVSEAAQASSDIAQNIAGVAQAAQSTSSGAGQCQGAAAELGLMSTEMQSLVAQFSTFEALGVVKAAAPVLPGGAANENARVKRAKLAAV
jgi:methyl-accepting chemotaxis protein